LREFVVIGTRAVTSQFSLDDMPGTGRRMDVMARAVSAALLLSNGMRRDATVRLVLLGPPEAPKTLTFSGERLRSLSPDERSIGGLIYKALEKVFVDGGEIDVESSPGVRVARAGIDELVHLLENEKGRVVYLHEDGEPIASSSIPKDPIFIIGDDLGMADVLHERIKSAAGLCVSLGRQSYQTDQCITIVNHRLDMDAKDTNVQ